MSLSEDARTAIIAAAATAAAATIQPGENLADKTKEIATDLVTQVHERSPLSRHLDRVSESIPVHGVVESLEREDSSTRGIVTIQGRPSKANESGRESARTERTDGYDGVGLEQVKKLRSLVGHNVRLFIFKEPIGEGRHIRVVSHVQDLGVAE